MEPTERTSKEDKKEDTKDNVVALGENVAPTSEENSPQALSRIAATSNLSFHG
jgi:hypothetical protein